MKIRSRYLSALFVNVALPWLAYRLALPHWGPAWALAASALPLILWMAWDLARLRHFDALSAVVLTGTLLSLATLLSVDEARKRAAEQPLVAGMIGLVFLLSLAARRPLVFYLARSTLARESSAGAGRFETLWLTKSDLPAQIRCMTLVWGLGLIGENLLRGYFVWHWPDENRVLIASHVLQYAVYGVLSGWSIWYRATRIKQDTRTRAPAKASLSDGN